MNQHAKDVIERIVITFLEAFGAQWALTSFSLTKVALVSGVAAGLSAVYNVSKKLLMPTV